MITLQRKLAVSVKDHVFTDGKAPKGICQGQVYPVVGYSVQLRKRSKQEGTEKEYEEIAVFVVVNNSNDLSYLYPSYCHIHVDPFQEEICNSAFIKGEDKTDGKDKTGSQG